MEDTLAFERGQREVLEQIATDAPLPAVLDQIVHLIERQAVGMLCSILLVDREHGTLAHCAAPSLPPAFVRTIDGSRIGPNAGSCGTAAYLGKRVIVEDIATHEYWRDYRDLALPLGLRACWSSPIFSAGGEVLATFAMYYREPRGPSDAEIAWVDHATHLAAIAVGTAHEREQIREQAALIDRAKDAILVRELDGVIRSWNHGAERLYGWSCAEAIGRKAPELLGANAELFARANQRVCESGEWTGEIAQRTKTGQPIIVEASWTLLRDAAGAPKSVLAINTDITEQHRLEAQVHRAQRVESLGTLAGGIAHDFNNILAAVSANVLLGLDDLPHGHPARQALVEIGKASARAAELVRRILTFSREQKPKRQPIDLATVVSEVLNLLRATVSNIEVDLRIAPDVSLIYADPTQVHQVVMNLCTNALQAMTHAAGVLDVSIERAALATPIVTATGELAPGEYVRLDVSDTGTGMDEITLDRIFDPFFSAREPGDGTGLGLALVHGVVRSHGGGVSVRSSPGHGSTFAVYWPSSESHAAVGASTAQTRPARGGGQVILVVDDEAAIVRVTTQLLERAGYHAHGDVDPRHALATFEADPQGIDAAVLDLSMPGLAGPDLARALLRIRPELPIVMTSGRIGPEDVSALRQLGVKEVLMKPSSIQELTAALDRHLRRS